MQKKHIQHIVFFDSYCILCNAIVQFLFRIDKNNRLYFAGLTSSAAKTYLGIEHIDTTDLETFVYYRQGRVFERSTAALKIAAILPWPWRVFRFFLFIPGWIRDPIYTLIARNREKLFGRKETCFLPSPTQRQRFLD